jgi:hypothetical protein
VNLALTRREAEKGAHLNEMGPMPRYKLLIAPLVAGLLLAWGGPAAADLWPPPWAKPRHRRHATQSQPAAEPPGDFHVRGFRSALFGMDQAQVLEVIAKDLKVPADRVETSIAPEDRTPVLTARVEALEPGPGPATVSYILGAGSHRLVRVAVSWDGAAPALIESGRVLASYFKGQAWEKDAIQGEAAEGSDAVSLFSGEDSDGAAAQVVVHGAVLDRGVVAPLPAGPASLTVIYTQDVDHPDIYRLAPGAF